MLRYFLSALLVILALPVFAETPATNLTTVKISFIEALDPKDTTSSQRFQEEYERAIDTGRDLVR